MAKITRKLYALAAKLNLLERGNPEDDFHIIVFRITGKNHVSELTEKEEKAVLTELTEMEQIAENSRKIGIRQQNKVWALIYELCKIDPSDAKPAERLCGAVEKILGKSSAKSDPFRWVKDDDAAKLINTLNRYVKSAKKKRK